MRGFSIEDILSNIGTLKSKGSLTVSEGISLLNAIKQQEDEEEEEMKCLTKAIKVVLVVVGIFAVLGAAAYGVYRFINRDYDDDFDEDFEDFDDDFYDDIDELDEFED